MSSEEPRKLDEQCALALGWHKGKGAAVITWQTEMPTHWYDANGRRMRSCVLDSFMNLEPFSPTSNHEDARLLEDEIARRGLQDEYVLALLTIVVPNRSSVGAFWSLIRAAPGQKVRAFLAVVGGGDG